jgi:PAS domain S-box-containing protein
VLDRLRGFQEQEPRLLSAITQAPLAICKFWVDGTLVSVVEGGDRLGLSATQNLAQHYRKAFADTPQMISCIERAFDGLMVSETLPFAGAAWDARFFPTKDPQQGVVGVVAILTDASERLSAFQVLRTLDILAGVSRCLARSDGETIFLQQICELIGHNCSTAWIGLVDRTDESRGIRVVATEERIPYATSNQSLGWKSTDKSGQHIAGEAIRTGKIQITNDLIASADCRPWHDAALSLGWRSALAVPLLTDGASLGVLVLFSASRIEAQEPSLWEHVAADIVEGILTLRTRENQRQILADRQELNENYRRLVETAFDIIIVHRGLKIVDISNAGIKLAGAQSREDILGAPLLSLVAPNDRKRIQDTFKPHDSRPQIDEIQPVEFSLLGLDASLTEVEGVTVSIQQAGEDAQLSVLRDISQRKRQEKALSDAKASLDHAQRIARMASVDIDVPSGHTRWSANAYNVLGVSPEHESLSFLQAFDGIGDDEQRRLHELLDRIRIKGAASSAEVRLPFRETFKTIHVHGIPLAENRDDVNRIFVVLQDVTKLRLVESGLKRTTERLRTAQEIGRMGDFEIRVVTQQMSLSQGAAQMLELAPTDSAIATDAFIRRFSERNYSAPTASSG